MLRRVIAACLILGVSTPLHAQTLRERVEELFRFGNCDEPLCLAGSLAENGHGLHYIPAATQGNLALIDFVTEAIGLNVASVPVPATSSGATFAFQGGVPVKTSVSAGPFLGERAPTLGRGRLLVGANVTSVNFTTLRGVPLKNLQFTFTHQDVPGGGGGLGDPEFENEVIDVTTALDVNLIVTQFFTTYGITDWLDFGVAVPLVNTSLTGRATAQIVPFGDNAPHFFAGTSANPVLRATSFVDGSSTGIGDIAVRAKLNLSRGARGGFSLLGDVRFPTGDEDELSDVVTDDVFKATVTVIGAFDLDTQIGGNTTVPHLTVDKLKVIGNNG